MSTIKANNYSQASKELEAIEKGLSASISEDVKAGNENHFNVVMVQRINDAVNERYLTKLVPQTFSSEGYEKVKKQFKYLGYTKIILLHDPTLKEEVKQPVVEPTKEEEVKQEQAAKAEKK